MATPYTTPSYGTMYETGQPEITYPIPQTPSAQFIIRTYEDLLSNYITGNEQGALDDPDPIYGGFYLVTPGVAQWRDGELIRWKTTYANVPPARNEYQNYQYRFPGIGNYATGGYFRLPYSATVNSRVAYSYFLTTNPEAVIPIIQAFTINQSPGGVGYPLYIVDFVEDTSGGPGQTYPGAAAYASYVADGVWLVAEATAVRRYAGNIWESYTRYVLAN